MKPKAKVAPAPHPSLTSKSLILECSIQMTQLEKLMRAFTTTHCAAAHIDMVSVTYNSHLFGGNKEQRQLESSGRLTTS